MREVSSTDFDALDEHDARSASQIASSQPHMNKSRWIQTVDRLMKRDWCIDTADAGLEEAELARFWREGEEPAAFVAWFAEKHDLTRFERNPFRPARA